MSEKFTKGPWHVDGPLDNEGDEDAPTGCTWFDVIGGGGHSVAHLPMEARPESQHLRQVKADADLIAAAPEMFEALKKAHNEINLIRARCGVPWWDTGKSDVTEEAFSEIVEECYVALKKARGEV